ncbi:hypothetical protein M514_13806 [Trichuris suis]|uniref:Uncharacterized protein n=1 Tax=Trichuris suis TaxID=68888 RepID=A0A085NTP3_9BILA|nr:hypothetical protein M513_13806 [Trichuris suis]KFD72839.1 hypothetical protein M514_13806 [Trichuris suis]
MDENGKTIRNMDKNGKTTNTDKRWRKTEALDTKPTENMVQNWGAHCKTFMRVCHDSLTICHYVVSSSADDG